MRDIKRVRVAEIREEEEKKKKKKDRRTEGQWEQKKTRRELQRRKEYSKMAQVGSERHDMA